MAPVKINRGMPRPEAPAASLPKDEWESLLIVRRYWVRSQLPFDCRMLRQVAEDAQIMAPELGYDSAEQFLRQELELDPDLVNRVVGWLEREQPTGPVALERADRASRAEAHAAAAKGLEGAFAPEGRPCNGSKENTYIVKVTGQGAPGNSAAYLAARLKKAGREDLLEQIGPGKPHRSVRSAAIEAGIIKPVAVVRLTTPDAIAAKLQQHLSPDDLAQIVAILTEALAD